MYVSAAAGSDTAACGAIDTPCASIAQGESRAVSLAKTSVFVAGGSYQRFSLLAGLDVEGGYGSNWQRGTGATGLTTVTVDASFDASVGGPVGVTATGITTATKLASVTVVGAAAATGQASYGIVIQGSSSALVLDSVTVIAGAGGPGASGAAGTAGAPPVGSQNGGAGGNGDQFTTTCNDSSRGGGGSAGGTGSATGGAGGEGGTMDTACNGFNLDFTATPGANGSTRGVHLWDVRTARQRRIRGQHLRPDDQRPCGVQCGSGRGRWCGRAR